MENFMEFLSSQEVKVAAVIALSGIFLIIIVLVIEKLYSKHRLRKNTKMLKNMSLMIEEEKSPDVEIKKQIEKPVVSAVNDSVVQVAPVKEEIKEEIKHVVEVEDNDNKEVLTVNEIQKDPKKEIEQIYSEVKEEIELLEVEEDNNKEKLEYTSIEPNEEEAKEELKRLTEELVKKEEEKDKNIELTEFEKEQEENAIISMEELMQKSGVLYEQNEVTQYKDEGNEPISLQDLEKRMNTIKEDIELLDVEEEKVDIKPTIEKQEKVVLDDFNTIDINKTAYKDPGVFKSSPIISPIFGIEEVPNNNDMMFENTANYEKFDEEIRKTNEFIVTLKELQKKLD